MIELALVIAFIAFLVGLTAVWEVFRGPDPDLTDADDDPICYRCGARGWPKHVHSSDR